MLLHGQEDRVPLVKVNVTRPERERRKPGGGESGYGETSSNDQEPGNKTLNSNQIRTTSQNPLRETRPATSDAKWGRDLGTLWDAEEAPGVHQRKEPAGTTLERATREEMAPSIKTERKCGMPTPKSRGKFDQPTTTEGWKAGQQEPAKR